MLIALLQWLEVSFQNPGTVVYDPGLSLDLSKFPELVRLDG